MILFFGILLITLLFVHFTSKKHSWTAKTGMIIIILSISGLGHLDVLQSKILSKQYSAATLPEPYFGYVQNFKVEAAKKNIDTTRLSEIKFFINDSNYNFSLFAGACQKETHELVIPHKNVNEKTMWHELGHCVLDYSHYYEAKDKNQIMYYASGKIEHLDTEMISQFFSNKPNVSTTKTDQFKNPYTLFFSAFLSLIFLDSLFQLINGFLNQYIQKRFEFES